MNDGEIAMLDKKGLFLGAFALGLTALAIAVLFEPERCVTFPLFSGGLVLFWIGAAVKKDGEK